MKPILHAMLTALCIIPTAQAKDAKPEMMKAFVEYSTPSEAHKMLADLAGKWKYTSKMWEPGSETPEESSGTSTMKIILGGRFLQQEVKGKAMGMPFQGLGFTGYNNLTKKYETIWLDSMGTGIMHGNGSYDAETRTLTDTGEFTCPMSKAKNKSQEYRSEWKIIDKNNTVFTMFARDEDGKESKMMELVYKRSK